MPTKSGDLLVHPVRLRAIRALLQEPMTAGELQDVLGDVAQATLYRHLTALEDGGIIEVVERRQARGATERTFAVVDGAGTMHRQDVTDASAEDHLRWFTTFVGTLLTDFAAYLDSDDIDVAADRVSYRQVPLWLTDQETDDLITELREVLSRRTNLQPDNTRRRRILTTILLPDDRARHARRRRRPADGRGHGPTDRSLPGKTL